MMRIFRSSMIFPDIKTRLWLADNIAQHWISTELTGLVLNSVAGLLHIAFVVFGKLIYPERFNRRIGNVVHHFLSVVFYLRAFG